MSGDPVTARKKKIKGGHKVHLRKLISSVNHFFRYTGTENNAELLPRKLQSDRKVQIISKLDEKFVEEIENEWEITHEIETADERRIEIAIFTIKLETVLQQKS